MSVATAARSMLWGVATCIGSTISRPSGSNVFQQPLVASARGLALQTCTSPTLLPHSSVSAVTERFRWPSSARQLQGNIHQSPVAGYGSQLSSRGYKIITQAIVDLPKVSFKGPPGANNTGIKQAPRGVTDSCNRMTRLLHEARMPEGWMRKKFYIKPKYRRNEKRWAGVLKRKRRDFNYKLRWALKSMSR